MAIGMDMEEVGNLREHDAPSIADLVRELNHHSAALLRDELALARVETRQAFEQSRRIAAWVGAAAAPAAAALVCVALGVTAVLASWMPIWLAAFIGAVAFGAVAGAFALTARRRIRAFGNPLPRTTRTLKEGKGWLKEQAS